jgi:hypothetical protein
MRIHNPEDFPLAGGAGEAGEGSGRGQVDAGGSQAAARRGGEVSHSVRDPDPEPAGSACFRASRIRIHESEVRIRGSGSAPKCHGSPTLVCHLLRYSFFFYINYLRSSLVRMRSSLAADEI